MRRSVPAGGLLTLPQARPLDHECCGGACSKNADLLRTCVSTNACGAWGPQGQAGCRGSGQLHALIATLAAPITFDEQVILGIRELIGQRRGDFRVDECVVLVCIGMLDAVVQAAPREAVRPQLGGV